MTISSTVRVAGPFVGNGTASVFPFAFKVFTATDLDVIRFASSTGIETTLVLNSDYSVTLNGDQNSNPGGSVNLIAKVLPTGFTLTITSDIANLQPTDLTNQGGFYPEVITDSLDRATIQIQQISDIGDRTLKIPISDGTSLNMELPTATQRANAFLAFDATGEPVVLAAGTSGAPATIVRQVFSGTGSQTVFNLASDPGGLGNSALIYIGGVFQQRSTYTIIGTVLTFSTAPVAGTDNIEFVNFLTDNVGSVGSDLVLYTPDGTNSVARSATSKFNDVISVKDFGADSAGEIDSTAAFNNAFAASGTKNVFVPGGSYVITGTVTGDFYSDANVNIISGTVNTIHRIGSILSAPTAIVNAVQFPATQVPSLDPNTLDDYEEGIWTPAITFGGAATGVTYDTARTKGSFVKVGRTVFVNGRLTLTSKGSSTGAALITGLTFASSASTHALELVSVGFYANITTPSGGYMSPGASDIVLVTGGATALTDTNFQNTTDVMFSVIYRTSN